MQNTDKKYAIADIGSNTIVLIIYTIENGMPRTLEYRSEAAHLISYVKDHRMRAEGIEKAVSIVNAFSRELDEAGISFRYGDITEPGRVENRDELVLALETTGFRIRPLSGKEEAELDFQGALLSVKNSDAQIAFDVGGGSSELIAFSGHDILAAVSMPLGCVRLLQIENKRQACIDALEQQWQKEPGLRLASSTVIGIGGTVRAAGLVCGKMFGTPDLISLENLEELMHKIQQKDAETEVLMHAVLTPSRVGVFLPGLTMVQAVMERYEAKQMIVSSTGIREGFLLKCLQEQN